VVTLAGTVSTAAVKAAAIDDVRKVDLVEGVNDQLVVKAGGPLATALPDDVVKRNVQSVLRGSAELIDVDAAVNGGHVHLTGTVDSDWERLRAAQADEDLRVAARRE